MHKQTLVHWYYGILFRNKNKWAINPHLAWMNLKYALLREKSQSEKATYCMIPIIWHSEKCKSIAVVKRSVFPRGSGAEEGSMSKAQEIDLFLEWSIYSLWYYNCGYVTLCLCHKPWILKQRVNFTVCKFLIIFRRFWDPRIQPVI